MRILRRFCMSGLFLATAVWTCHAATFSGQVKDTSNLPVANAQVIIPSIQKGTQTDSSGSFKLENVPSGSYVVEFQSQGSPTATKQIDTSKGDVALEVVLEATSLTLAPITITASPTAKSSLNTPASVSVVEGRQLDKERGESVISAIQDQPGVNMIAEGPTVVKPEIRGLNSQDIVVVEDGVRVENLQWGNEHAPEVDSLGSDRIEVLRGPNSLMYGSDALGGVIAINHPDLPNAHLGAGPLSGLFRTDVNSNNNSAGENFEASGASGDWGYRANISQLQAGDFHNPQIGDVYNTGLQQVSGSGAIGVRKDWGSIDADYGHFNKRVELQNPSAPYPGPLSDLEYQTLAHDHAKFHSTLLTDAANWDFTLGYDRANRKEFDAPSAPGNDPHLNWIETSYTLDAKAQLAPMGPFQGTLGVSGLRRIEQTLGLVDLTPPYNENGIGAYLVEDLPVGKFDFTAGVRGDEDQYNIGADDKIGIDPDNSLDNPHPVAAQTLNYSAVTAAAGGVYHVTDPFAIAVNVGRGYRNPVPFELFAYGVHEGGGVFQIGNPNLTPETSLDTEASLRWSSPGLKAEVGVFKNYIQNYIYGTYTGATDPGTGLPIVTETQGNATIQGFDGAITGAPTNWLTLKTVYNMLSGYNDSVDAATTNNYLSHIPANNILFGSRSPQQVLGVCFPPVLWRR